MLYNGENDKISQFFNIANSKRRHNQWINLVHFRINSPKVIHETIDGETVIVNLDSGNYYSLDDIGADIWDSIGKGVPVDHIIDRYLLPIHRGKGGNRCDCPSIY